MAVLPAWSKTAAFNVNDAIELDKINQGQGNAVALVEGTKGFERLVRKTAAYSATGTVNNLSLAGLVSAPDVCCSGLMWSGAANLTLTGISAGAYHGMELLVQNITSANWLLITTQSSGSTAANRVICESAYGQYLGPGGSALLVYDDDVTHRWRLHLLNPGAPITPTFSAGDYTNWTVGSGDVLVCKFQHWGKSLKCWVSIATASATGGNDSLDRVIPGGFGGTNAQICGWVYMNDNGSITQGYGYTPGGGSTLLEFHRLDGADPTASTNNTQVQGVLDLEVD